MQNKTTNNLKKNELNAYPFTQLLFATIYKKSNKDLKEIFYRIDDAVVNWTQTTQQTVFKYPLFDYYTTIVSTLYHTGNSPPEWDKYYPLISVALSN